MAVCGRLGELVDKIKIDDDIVPLVVVLCEFFLERRAGILYQLTGAVEYSVIICYGPCFLYYVLIPVLIGKNIPLPAGPPSTSGTRPDA